MCDGTRDDSSCAQFLATLERHFKNISTGPLGGILDTLPPMMNALRMVRRGVRGRGPEGARLRGASWPPRTSTHGRSKRQRDDVMRCARPTLPGPQSCGSALALPSTHPALTLKPAPHPTHPPLAAPVPLQVWIISRHYSDDQRMGSLFQRIAREVADRVEGAVELRHIFRMASADAVGLLRVCKSVLEQWLAAYM